MAAEWDYERNTGTPAEYTAQSNKKVWWHNSRRGHFQAVIQNRTQGKQQAGQVRCILADLMQAQCGQPALAFPPVYAYAWQPCHADVPGSSWLDFDA